ncbi:uncharacterized protein TNCV_1150911 [Trichonephila clavipes]|nr:uncharacterized protein TNCV_1150911 [Trichonephila clavipes]
MGDRILFTDESRFSHNTNSRRSAIWKEPGTLYLPSNVHEIDNYGGKGLMVWEGIMLDDRTPLHDFERGSVIGVSQNSLSLPLCLFVSVWEAIDHPQGIHPENWVETEQNRFVTYMVLKAKANDRRKNLTPSFDEFHGP